VIKDQSLNHEGHEGHEAEETGYVRLAAGCPSCSSCPSWLKLLPWLFCTERVDTGISGPWSKIRRQEGLSQTELADFLDMQPIPVGRVIDRLEKTGYLERRADPGDRRRWRLYLTPKAHAVVAEMEVIAKGLRDDALRDIAREDFETLLRVLAQIKDNLVALDGAPNDERAAP